MRVHPNHRPAPRDIGILVGVGLAVALVLGALIAANTRWSALLPGGGGFYSLWASAREFLFQHRDPYGGPAAALAQQLAYGGAAGPTQNPYRLDLPFFLVPLYFPLGLISDPIVARGVWATMGQMALVAAILICVRLVEWHPARRWLFAVSLLALLTFPAIAALVEGTPATILLLIYTAILWAMKTGNDELAGALAVLTLCKWEVGLPFLVLLTIRMVQEQRWRVAAGFGMALTILLVIAFLVFPGWFTPFLVGTVAMLRSGHGLSTQDALLALVPEGAPDLAVAVTIVLVCLLTVEAIGMRRPGFQRFVWTACLALAASPLLGFRTEIPNLIMVLPGLALIAAGGSHRGRYGRWISLGLLALLFGIPWFMAGRASMPQSMRSGDQILLLLPALCMFGMYWTRWWYLQPARTWMDEIRESR